MTQQTPDSAGVVIEEGMLHRLMSGRSIELSDLIRWLEQNGFRSEHEDGQLKSMSKNANGQRIDIAFGIRPGSPLADIHLVAEATDASIEEECVRDPKALWSVVMDAHHILSTYRFQAASTPGEPFWADRLIHLTEPDLAIACVTEDGIYEHYRALSFEDPSKANEYVGHEGTFIDYGYGSGDALINAAEAINRHISERLAPKLTGDHATDPLEGGPRF